MQSRINKTFNINSEEDINFLRKKTASFLAAYQSLKNFYYWTALFAISIFSSYQLGFTFFAYAMLAITMVCYSPFKAIGTRNSFDEDYQNNLHELIATYGWCIAAGPHVLNHPDVQKMVEAMANHVEQECLLPMNYPHEAELPEEFKSILANSQHKILKNLLSKPKEEKGYFGNNKEELKIIPYDPKNIKSTRAQLWEDSCRLINNGLFSYKPPVSEEEGKVLQAPSSFFGNFFKETIAPNISAATIQALSYKKS